MPAEGVEGGSSAARDTGILSGSQSDSLAKLQEIADRAAAFGAAAADAEQDKTFGERPRG